MSEHVRRSRITKALTDNGLVGSFSEAEAHLDAIHICVHVSDDQLATAAGQAAALTTVVTASKCFGRVSLAITRDTVLIASMPAGQTLAAAAGALGAVVRDAGPLSATHHIQIGGTGALASGWVQCWWSRWLTGVRTTEAQLVGDSRLSLSGIFAGALAVRQIFESVRLGSIRSKDTTVNLWAPWFEASIDDPGPDRFTLPEAVWLVGLGHLGQAYVWNLLFLPARMKRRAILQDDQRIGPENVSTSLLVTSQDINERKVRVASRWLETNGWETQLIERRHRGDIAITADDPPFLLGGLDDLKPRRQLARVGFEYMIDGGIGNGPGDFEGIQVRAIPKYAPVDSWGEPQKAKPVEDLLARPAYQILEQAIGACGAYPLASASVAVPFVGAAAGALVVTQMIRLVSMFPSRSLLQLDLGSPDMVIDSAPVSAPGGFLGGEVVTLG